MTVHRLTISLIHPDPRASHLLAGIATLTDSNPDSGPDRVDIDDVILFVGTLDATDRHMIGDVLIDPVLQRGTWDVPTTPAGATVVEVARLAGVTDPMADAATLLTHRLGLPVTHTAVARRYTMHGLADAARRDSITGALLANDVIERWQPDAIDVATVPTSPVAAVEPVILRGLDEAGLAALNVERRMSLDPAELRVLQAHFEAEGREPTDVEIETIAQTWSEHCSHKTFRALLNGPDGTTAVPLLKQLREATDSIDAPFVRSAFVGNAGIISFSPGRTLALKAETHNHPSAIEPFGGANTGVGGVIRDVMGAAHRPIAVTDILCFGPADHSDPLPAGVHHPLRIRDGVVAGVADYGNKIGLPTVAGAILYDAGYTANPLVFCGAIGSAADAPIPSGPYAGDRVIVLGGRTGRDGLRGATFSSATMDASTGEVAGASVQIGDPIVEKLLIDLLDDIRHLYTAITDCGAGGLSSSVGEMAEVVGADVELSVAPLKYPGLAPWEIWLSEAQERMVIAVAPEHVEAIAERCAYHGVEMTDLGSFSGDGRLVVRMNGAAVLDLDTTFLHDGRPQRTMTYVPASPSRHVGPARVCADPAAALLRLLAHPNIASKESVIRRYDHEIRGATVVRPLVGWNGDGPADGVVIAEPADTHGFAIGIGVNPWYGLHDPEWMAHAVVDEAIRNVVAVGADPSKVALLDNFSWGDPRRETTLGELLAAVEGCCAAAVAHQAPFVSGKDSLNNEYVVASGERRSVPPTLVITAVAYIPDADHCVTPDLKAPGNVLLLIGPTAADFAGSHFDMIDGTPDRPGRVSAPDAGAPGRYATLHAAIQAGLVAACHDCSEGGLAVTLAEMCLGGGLGAIVDTLPHADITVSWFAETAGRFVVEVTRQAVDEFITRLGTEAIVIGEVTAEPSVTIVGGATLPLDALATAWRTA